MALSINQSASSSSAVELVSSGPRRKAEPCDIQQTGVILAEPTDAVRQTPRPHEAIGPLQNYTSCEQFATDGKPINNSLQYAPGGQIHESAQSQYNSWSGDFDGSILPFNETIEPQPRSRSISHEELTAEVKGIYAGLQMVEQKCIQVINESRKAHTEGKAEKHWQALIALHRTLLHEHHDFLLASQHPSASKELRALASKYSMPARMWKHGIHNFLERLRHSLPSSHEFMLAFLILAYQMVSLLYETVPTFRQTWIECLGDLSRYRMAIEEENPKDREVWTQVSRYWYFKAADENPYTGRIYHHLAILSRTQPVQQLMLYSCALTAKIPFLSANESINTLLDPAIERVKTANKTSAPEIIFVCVIALQYKRKDFETILKLYLRELPSHVQRLSVRFREQSAQMAIVLLCSLRGFGAKDSILHQVLLQDSVSSTTKHAVLEGDHQGRQKNRQYPLDKAFSQIHPPLDIWIAVLEELLKCGLEAIMPYIYVSFCFVVTLVRVDFDFSYILDILPWVLIERFLNDLYERMQATPGIHQHPISIMTPIVLEGETPIPEDVFLRVPLPQLYPDNYANAFSDDQDERSRETEETTKVRNERVLRAAFYLAKQDRWLKYDAEVGFKAITKNQWAGRSPPSPNIAKKAPGFAMFPSASFKTVDEHTEMIFKSQRMGKSPSSATPDRKVPGSAMLSPNPVKIVDEDTEMLDIGPY